VIRLLPRNQQPAHPDVSAALQDCRRAFWSVALFSGVVNLLMLAGPLYMLQIYDRVLASRSVPTLVALSIFLVGAFAFQGVLDVIRSRIVVRAATLLDWHLGTTVHRAVVALGAQGRRGADAHQPVRDLDQIRAFLTGAGPIAIVDLPWMPFFLAICFMIHPLIGYLALAGAVLLFVLTLRMERASRNFARLINDDSGTRAAMVEAGRRNSPSVVAMGMEGALGKRWTSLNDRFVTTLARSTDIINSYGSVTKVLRFLLQSAILGLGAYLVIAQEMTAGAMIAASIMMGRALAPLEVAIANWRAFISARDSTRRLSALLAQLPPDRTATELPKPRESLEVNQVTVAAPGSNAAIVSNVHFRITAGEILGIIGPNGSGKSSLARALVGVWPPARGTVRLDGAALDQWDPDARGRHIGYVSQTADLFQGTVAENIARMSLEPDSAAVLRAAHAAGAHEMILRLPSGYDTVIGDGGEGFSIGQRQRIALARAFYGDPFLVLLDEPSTNLDGEGEAALQKAIRDLKARRAIVIVIAHRKSALAACDKVLVLLNGVQQAFGPRDDVLRKIATPAPPAPAAGANLKVS